MSHCEPQNQNSALNCTAQQPNTTSNIPKQAQQPPDCNSQYPANSNSQNHTQNIQALEAQLNAKIEELQRVQAEVIQIQREMNIEQAKHSAIIPTNNQPTATTHHAALTASNSGSTPDIASLNNNDNTINVIPQNRTHIPPVHAGEKLKRCTRYGCGKMFTDSSNHDKACSYHVDKSDVDWKIKVFKACTGGRWVCCFEHWYSEGCHKGKHVEDTNHPFQSNRLRERRNTL